MAVKACPYKSGQFLILTKLGYLIKGKNQLWLLVEVEMKTLQHKTQFLKLNLLASDLDSTIPDFVYVKKFPVYEDEEDMDGRVINIIL